MNLIKTAKDIQEALKDLLGETLQNMLDAEMNEHLGYDKNYIHSSSSYLYGLLPISIVEKCIRWLF